MTTERTNQCVARMVFYCRAEPFDSCLYFEPLDMGVKAGIPWKDCKHLNSAFCTNERAKREVMEDRKKV